MTVLPFLYDSHEKGWGEASSSYFSTLLGVSKLTKLGDVTVSEFLFNPTLVGEAVAKYFSEVAKIYSPFFKVGAVFKGSFDVITLVKSCRSLGIDAAKISAFIKSISDVVGDIASNAHNAISYGVSAGLPFFVNLQGYGIVPFFPLIGSAMYLPSGIAETVQQIADLRGTQNKRKPLDNVIISANDNAAISTVLGNIVINGATTMNSFLDDVKGSNLGVNLEYSSSLKKLIVKYAENLRLHSPNATMMAISDGIIYYFDSEAFHNATLSGLRDFSQYKIKSCMLDTAKAALTVAAAAIFLVALFYAGIPTSLGTISYLAVSKFMLCASVATAIVSGIYKDKHAGQLEYLKYR